MIILRYAAQTQIFVLVWGPSSSLVKPEVFFAIRAFSYVKARGDYCYYFCYYDDDYGDIYYYNHHCQYYYHYYFFFYYDYHSYDY